MFNLQLETFICVADAGSFNKAAEELYISPPAVIKQINAIESELGLTLFVRTHRGLVLTEAGESFYNIWSSISKVPYPARRRLLKKENI